MKNNPDSIPVNAPAALQAAPHIRGWAALFAISALEGLAGLVALAATPADVENALVLGFSARRLALMGILLAASAACAALALAAGRTAAWQSLDRRLNPAARRATCTILMALLPLGAIFAALAPLVLMSLYRTSGEFRYYAYYERLLPLFAWAGLFCLQAAFWIGWTGNFAWKTLHSQRTVFRAGVVVLAVFAGVWLLVSITGIGITPDRIGWGAPAAPLLEWQIWLALLAGIGFLLFLAWGRWPRRGDLWISLAIWLLAVWLWIGQPIHTAFFATAGRQPNYEIYPFSDGAYYGLFAQSLLIGNGFQGSEVPPRPFYITLLAGFHAVAGQGYEQVILVQTLLLALLPVVLYWIGKELHSRPAGLIIALLSILRELTAMITSPITDKASTSQLFFADLPSALAIALWALLAILWLKAPQKRPLLALLTGGGMGLAMLFRTQSIFMLPGILLLALFALRGRWRVWILQSGLVLLGLALMIIPWLWRNWQVTGSLAFDDPKSQTGVMAQRYTFTKQDPEEEFIIRPGEDLQQFSQRAQEGIFSYMLQNPGEVAYFVSSHLLNAEIDNLLLLPVRDGLFRFSDLLMPGHAFWQSWKGTPSFAQAALMALNLALIALGIGAAWARYRWAGLALLLMNLSYNASNALARNSGLRYLLPLDWTVYAYAALGLLELAVAVIAVLGLPPTRLSAALAAEGDGTETPFPQSGLRWKPALLLGLSFLAIGSIPLLAEHAFPRRYPVQGREVLARELLSQPSLSEAQADRPALERFLSQPGVRLVKGRALYPRYYAAGEGEPRTAKAGYEPLDFARTVFQVASNDYYGMAMLRAGQPPRYFPNASDVIVAGCAPSGYIEASVVLVLDQPGVLYLSDGGLPVACPTEK